MEKIKCPLCGKQAILKATEQKGYQEPDRFSIYHCEHCNTAFSMPRVNADNIYELIYKDPEKVRGYNLYYRFYNEIKKQKDPLLYLTSESLTYWSVVYSLKKIIKATKQSNIFEVGSGLGYLTYALHKKGYNITGLDISKEAVNQARNDFGNYFVQGDIYQYANEHPNSVDIIILTEVIEHIETPIDFIKALSKMLRSGGSLIITTPNKSYYSPDEIWETDSPPVHCWWLSEESMTYISKQANLSIEFLDYSKSWQARMSRKNKSVMPSVDWIFNPDGSIKNPQIATRNNYGILPNWLKETILYRKTSNFIYPLISKLYPSNKRSSAFCAILKKQ